MYEYSNVYVNKMYFNVTRPTPGEYCIEPLAPLVNTSSFGPL